MGIAERKQRQKEEVRLSILQAAWQIVLAEGWQALSIRKIAEAIEYSVPVIYDHFANKEAILLEFTKNGFHLLNQQLQKAAASSTSPETQINAMAQAYWSFAFNNKSYYQVMFGLGMPSCETVSQVSELGAFSELLQQPIAQLIRSRNDTAVDPLLKFHTFWSMLHGLVSINMMNPNNDKQNLNQMVLHDLCTSFIAGIKT